MSSSSDIPPAPGQLGGNAAPRAAALAGSEAEWRILAASSSGGRGPQPCRWRGAPPKLARRGAPLTRPAGPGLRAGPKPSRAAAGRCARPPGGNRACEIGAARLRPRRVVRRPPARQPAIPCTSRGSGRVSCRRGRACGSRRRGVLPAGAARRPRGSGGIPALRVGNWDPPVCGNLVENWPICGANSRQMDVFTRRQPSGGRRLQNKEIKWFSHRWPVYSAVTRPVGQQKRTFWPFCTGVIVLSFKPSAGKRKFPQAGATH